MNSILELLYLNCQARNIVQAQVDDIKKTHLRDLMNDVKRCQSMMVYDHPVGAFHASLSFTPCFPC